MGNFLLMGFVVQSARLLMFTLIGKNNNLNILMRAFFYSLENWKFLAQRYLNGNYCRLIADIA